jgi:hypothetical protein
MKNERTIVSLRYQNNQQVYKRPKHSIYREGVRATHPLLPFIKSYGLGGPWVTWNKSSKLNK